MDADVANVPDLSANPAVPANLAAERFISHAGDAIDASARNGIGSSLFTFLECLGFFITDNLLRIWIPSQFAI